MKTIKHTTLPTMCLAAVMLGGCGSESTTETEPGDEAESTAEAASDQHTSGFLPHNTEHTVYPFGYRHYPPCFVTVQHGNFWGAAYAKIRSNSDNCVYIDVFVTALKDGQLISGYNGEFYPIKGKWYQATVTYASIVGSEFYAIDYWGESKEWTYSGI